MFEHYLADHAAQPRGNADPDRSTFSLLRMPDNILRVADLHDEFSRFFQKRVPGFGEFYFALVAHKKGNTQVLLQLPDLAT